MPLPIGNPEGSRQTPPTRILLVDPSPAYRRVVAEVLRLQERWEVCGEAGWADAAIQMLRRERPDVVVVEPSLPDSLPRETIASFVREALGAPILVYSWRRERSPTRSEYRLLGASAFVDKQDDIWSLVRSLSRLVASLPDASARG